MGKRLAKKVLLIGWDAADWKVINPLLDAGMMPTLERLVNRGVIGNIATMDPPLSPILWTTIATGKRPFKHGILGFVEPDESGTGVRPTLSTSRKARAVWDILGQHGLKTHVVGWWPSHPAEKVNGICISNMYQLVKTTYDQPWPLAPGAVYPPEKEDFFKNLRVHPAEITENHVLPFIPDAAKIDPNNAKKLVTLTKLLADCSSIHAAATYILEQEEWDFVGVYYNALDLFCHHFMGFHPPKRDHIAQEDYDLYKDVISGAYRFFDMMLERLVELAGDDATIMLVSDHGFHPDHLRLENLPNDPMAPAYEHSQYGIFCLSGPGAKKDEIIHGASLTDVTPTVLSLFGLPVGEDMDGKVLTAAFSETVIPNTVKTWETQDNEHHTLPAYLSQTDSDAMVKQLADLGYIEQPAENSEQNRNQALLEQRFFLARSYMDAGLYNEAAAILRELQEHENAPVRYTLYLLRALLNVGSIRECRKILDETKAAMKVPNVSLDLFEGTLLLDENEPLKAVEIFQDIQKKAGRIAGVQYLSGRGYLSLNLWDEALKAFEQELDINYENAHAHQGIGLVYLRTLNYEKAAHSFLTAVGLNFNMPYAHYQLGVALYHMGMYTKAAEAFEVSLSLSPHLNKAREMLAKIYHDHLNDEAKAALYLKLAEENAKDTIIVVSGLPRSGTSMMMQMLAAGGADIFADDDRQPDENNPRGYYEHEAVKGLARNNEWIGDAKGKAIKVISYLLPNLPAKYRYKVIFMERDLNEVLRSQHIMLANLGKASTSDVSLSLMKQFQRNLKKIEQWKQNRQNIEICYIAYAKAINEPAKVAKEINEFLGGNLNEHKMALAVDKNLYRQKSTLKREN